MEGSGVCRGKEGHSGHNVHKGNSDKGHGGHVHAGHGGDKVHDCHSGKKVVIEGEMLTIDDVMAVARGRAKVSISANAKDAIRASRRIVDGFLAQGEGKRAIYGITTGFGELAHVRIPLKDVEQLQRNLILSHACGTGGEISGEIVRAMMLLRINSLAKGFSGIRLKTVEALLAMLNSGVIPVVYEQGSVGASGDLVPLAHMAMVLIGEGEAYYKGERMAGRKAMKLAGITPIELAAKEGLALINGTQFMGAHACFAIERAANILKNAHVAAAASIEALKGTRAAFRRELHETRPHDGQLKAAANLWNLLEGSEILKNHENCGKVQDAYSLRCSPQVLGASIDAYNYVKGIVGCEINSVTDNPVILHSGETISGGNFHGQPLALAMDFLGLALAEVASISERRIARLVDPALSGLPAFLSPSGGLNSGLMIPQYTAASLVSENKVLCHPASCDSIPTSANQEDHVSMGSIAARKCLQIARNVEAVLAIEFLTACQALEFAKPLKPGTGAMAAYDALREKVPKLDGDRWLYPDMEEAKRLVENGEIVKRVEAEMNIKL